MNCPSCKGECYVLRDAFVLDGIKYPETRVPCFECNGTGEMCDVCGEAIDACGCDEEPTP